MVMSLSLNFAHSRSTRRRRLRTAAKIKVFEYIHEHIQNTLEQKCWKQILYLETTHGCCFPSFENRQHISFGLKRSNCRHLRNDQDFLPAHILVFSSVQLFWVGFSTLMPLIANRPLAQNLKTQPRCVSGLSIFLSISDCPDFPLQPPENFLGEISFLSSQISFLTSFLALFVVI